MAAEGSEGKVDNREKVDGKGSCETQKDVRGNKIVA